MHASLLASLVSLAAVVGAHPTENAHSLVGRGIDLNAFRLKTTVEYVNASIAESSPLRRIKRADYVDAATELVKSIANGATFRVVEDHYVGQNGIAHVNFKQTANDIDIDNADFNVNVSVMLVLFFAIQLTRRRSLQMVLSSAMAIRSFLEAFHRAHSRSATSRTQWTP